MKNKITVQNLATLLRDISYADDAEQGIEWSLSVIHPKDNDGVPGYGGGIWHKPYSLYRYDDAFEMFERRAHKFISVSFYFNEVNGISFMDVYFQEFGTIRNALEHAPHVNKKDRREDLRDISDVKEILVNLFGVKKLYREGQ